MQPLESGVGAIPPVEDIDAAAELIRDNDILRNNPRVMKLLENNFVTEDGRQLDPVNFLAAMLDYIETQDGQVKPELLAAEIEEQMVVHSKPTQLN